MSELVHWPPTWSTILLLPALFVAFTVHELAHALTAYLLGDTSQVERKRLTFNPLRHVSWVGLVVFLLFWFGWAKPVMVDPARFRIKNRALGMFLVSIAGASANVLVGLLVLMGIAATTSVAWVMTGASPVELMQILVVAEPGPDVQGVAVALSYYMMLVNLVLAFFNLLPFPPLDGFQAVVSLVAAVRAAIRSEPSGEPRPRWTPTRQEGEAAAGESDVSDYDGRSPAQIHFDIGLEYQKDGELDEAIARYRQATAHQERFALAYYNLGVAYWAKGRVPLAISSFRAAMQSGGDPAVRLQAELRLRELLMAEQNAEVEVGPAPPPLEPGEAPKAEEGKPQPPDPAAVRRMWTSLAIGGLGMLALAMSAWAFVTAVVLSEAGAVGLM